MTRQKKEKEKSTLDYIFWQNYLVYPNCRIIWVDVIKLEICQAHKLVNDNDKEGDDDKEGNEPCEEGEHDKGFSLLFCE